MNVLEALRQGHGFTDSEVSISEYLLAHADEISETPIGILASDMHRSKSSIDIASVRKAARLMLESRRVVYYAIGDSCAAISVFVQLMYKIGVVCASGLPMGDRGVLGRTLDSRDLAIIVTYSGNLVRTYRSTIDMLRAKGCKTILITGNPSLGESMLGTDCVFVLPSGETREERLATFFSQACTQYVLNCIFSEAYAANYQGNLTNWHEEMLPFVRSPEEA